MTQKDSRKVLATEVTRSPTDTRCQVSMACGHTVEVSRPHTGPWPTVGSRHRCIRCYQDRMLRENPPTAYPLVLLPDMAVADLFPGLIGDTIVTRKRALVAQNAVLYSISDQQHEEGKIMPRTPHPRVLLTDEQKQERKKLYSSGYWDGVRGVLAEFGDTAGAQATRAQYMKGHDRGVIAKAEGKTGWSPKRPPKAAAGKTLANGTPFPKASPEAYAGQVADPAAQARVIAEELEAQVEADSTGSTEATDSDGATVIVGQAEAVTASGT